MGEVSKKVAYLEKAKETARAKSPQDKESWERVARVYHQLAHNEK